VKKVPYFIDYVHWVINGNINEKRTIIE